MLLKGQGKKRTISSSLATSKGALYVGIRVLHWTTRYFDLYTTTEYNHRCQHLFIATQWIYPKHLQEGLKLLTIM